MLNPVVPGVGMPLYLQVACSIKKYLENHPTGHKLPSQRRIAALLNVSKTTVVEAFNVLVDDGVIAIREKTRAVSCLKVPGIDWPLIIHKARQSRIGDRRSEICCDPYRKNLLMWPGMDFSPQTPLMEVSDTVSRRIASADFMNYDDIGFLHLRELLSIYLSSSVAIDCSPDDIVITSGISNALYIIACAFFGRFTPVMYEAPGYYESIFTSSGAPAIPMTMRTGGIPPDVLQSHINRHRNSFFLTTPVNHWPTCHMTSEANKRGQYAVCRRSDVPVIEVDAMRSLFDAPLPMRSYPGSGENVIYVGTFTNTIGHSMRLAWIVAPRNTIKRLLEVKSQVEPRISNLLQIYAEEILHTGAYERYLEILKERVVLRNEKIEAMLRQHLGRNAVWQGLPGISRMITMNSPLNTNEVIRIQGRQISLLPLEEMANARSLYMYCAADSLSNTEALIYRLGQLCLSYTS